MALKCFTWITQLLRHTDDDDGLEGMLTRLPDCLLIDILSRLPADCLLRCQRDCKGWKSLISSRCFSTLHLRRAKPVLIIHEDRCFTSHKPQNLFVFDESLNKEKKMFRKVLLKRELMMNKSNIQQSLHLRYSCEGVLLFTGLCSPHTCFILNPITQEEVIVQNKFDPRYLRALYYCSLTREFKLLYAREEMSHWQYSIYSVRTKTWKKIHCPTPTLWPYVSPAIVNGAVHLLVSKDIEKPDTPPCAKGIMVLKMDKEELSNMPHPGSVMALECFTWITQLLCHTDDDDGLEGMHDDDGLEGMLTCLPDCLLIDILSRLPADCLLRCQRDCKVWKALTSSRYFSTLHLRRTRPVLIIHEDDYFTSHKPLNLFVFDESLNNKEEKMFRKVLLKRELMMNKFNIKHYLYLRYSCEGVLLFTGFSSTTCFILNPITQEEVIVHHKFDPRCLRALYYCSLTREFKLLCARLEKSRWQYSIYSVRTQTSRKIHCPTPNLWPCNSPAIVNGAVHMLVSKDMEKPDTPPCAKGIMVLKMDKEELSNMRHPGSVCSSWITHHTMSLLVKDESLCFCQLNISKNRMDIWMLEDYETWLWTQRYKVNLVFNNQGIRSRRYVHYWEKVMYSSEEVKPLHFLDGELVFYWKNRGLFMYNMDHNTLRNIQCPQGSMSYTCKPYKQSLLTIA